MTEYISREAAIKAAFRLCNKTDYPFIDDIQNALEELPAADVRPVVRGEWQEIPGLDDVPIKVYTCSLCHRVIKVPWPSMRVLEIAPFCHCGADMREVKVDG